MSLAETTLLGAIAGFTIFLGLPVGRLRHVDDRLRVALAMFSVGILAFIFMDVTSHGMEIVETSLLKFKDHDESFGHVLVLFLLMAAGFIAGTAGISAVQHRLKPNRPIRPPVAGGEVLSAPVIASYNTE